MAATRIFRQIEVMASQCQQKAGRFVVSAVEYRLAGRVLTVEDLWTTNDYRRQGLASQLMDEAEKEGKDNGCSRVEVTIPGTPGSARTPTMDSFFRSRGYTLDSADIQQAFHQQEEFHQYKLRLDLSGQ